MKKLLFFFLFFSLSTNVLAFNKVMTNISPYKTFNIKFNQKLDPKNDLLNSIKVVDSKGNKINVDVKMGSNQKSLLINPPDGGYTYGETYYLTVENLKSSLGKTLKNPYSLKFTISNLIITGTYDVTVGGFTAYKKITINGLKNYDGSVKYKYDVDTKFYKIGETASLIIPKETVIVYFYDEKNNLLGKATLNVGKSATSKSFVITK
jgi:hypothetical protein